MNIVKILNDDNQNNLGVFLASLRVSSSVTLIPNNLILTISFSIVVLKACT
jgi:hypothetical protein